MCILNFIRNLLVPVAIKKELDGLHEATIKQLWNEIYDRIYIIGETGTKEELIVRFPLQRIYQIDGYWKKYNYKTLDFMFYKIKLNSQTNYSFRDIQIILDFYSDNGIGYLEISRST